MTIRGQIATTILCATLALARFASADAQPTPTEPPATPTPAPGASVSTRGLSLETGGRLEESEKVRARWLERGGALVGLDAQAQAWGFAIPKVGGGGGGQLAAHATFYYLAPPDPAKMDTTWFAGRIGTGLEVGVGYAGILYKYFAPWNVTIPVALGGQVGIGSYRGLGVWRGVMLGADYRPSYTYMDLGQFGTSSTFSFVGGQVTIDIVTLTDVRARLAAMVKEPNWRFSAFLVPHIGNVPWFFVLGFGVVWY